MDSSRVIRSAGQVGGLTLVSRGMGFLRDILMARVFGTGLAMSAFTVAFRMPNLFRALFGEGALSAAFIPVFVETRHRDGDAAAWRVARQVFSLVGAVLLALVFAGMLLATGVLNFAPHLTPKAALVWSLLRIMLPYMFFICLAAVAMGVLNSFHHFFIPAATPWILNAVLIVALLTVCPRLGASPEQQIYGVAWAVLAAGLLQWAAQWPILLHHGWRPSLDFHWRDERLRRVLLLMGPAALGRAVTQVNVMIDSWLAVAVASWAPSALYYSERLIYLPMGIFATALSTVLLPVFSGHAARGDRDALRQAINHALRLLMFLMIPAAIGLLALAEPITRVAFERGAFDAASTLRTTHALWFYAFGMIVFSLGKVFVPAFYALQDPKTPVRVGLATVGLNIVLSVLFMVTWPYEYKHAGIAFATVVAETINGLWMAVIVHRRLGNPGWRAIGASVGRIALAAAGMAAAAMGTQAALARPGGGLGVRILALGGALAAGVAVYTALTWTLKSPEWTDLRAALRRRRRG